MAQSGALSGDNCRVIEVTYLWPIVLLQEWGREELLLTPPGLIPAAGAENEHTYAMSIHLEIV